MSSTIGVDTSEEILCDRIKPLLTQHAVRRYLVKRRWIVAVDGTQKFAGHQPIAPEALHQRAST